MPRKKVLIVDDSRDAAGSLRLLVETMGHDVHVVHDGQSAVDLALRVRPDVLFLDVVLPGMDGFAVARRVRAEPSLARMKIIALSGHASDEYRRRCAEAGCDQYLVKPLDPRFLESLLGSPLRP